MLGTWLLGPAIVFASLAAGHSSDKWLSPEYKGFFRQPLPILPEITPLVSYVDPSSGTPVDFYQMSISAFQTPVYPDLHSTNLVGYNAMSPGPTFRIQRGRQSVVRIVNKYDRPSVFHLHGSSTRAPWDGWAEDLIRPGEYKDYYFPNSQNARTMFYHDHAAGITAGNVYSGQSGFYILEDAQVEERLGLPRGKYDIPLAITAKQYQDDGQLASVADERNDVFGDVVHVNGQPWPFVDVEPRKYRFRLVDMSLSRSFSLSIQSSDGKAADFQVIASDAGLLSEPVRVSNLAISMAERYEIVVDFAPHDGQTMTMRNDRGVFVAHDYAGTDRVLEFKVARTVSSDENNGPVPTALVPLPSMVSKTAVDRTFKFDRDDDKWLINDVGFDDIKHRILARPETGDTEVWSLENHSDDWDHPIHVHMVDFHILSREKGRKSVLAYERVAMKDVVVLGPDERVTVLVQFAPFSGVYMFHCHNLIHEDHAMMAAFNISDVQGLGYGEADLAFANPLESRWRSQPYSDTDLASVESRLLPRFASSGAYANVATIQRAPDGYWATAASAHESESDSTAEKSGCRRAVSWLARGHASLAVVLAALSSACRFSDLLMYWRNGHRFA